MNIEFRTLSHGPLVWKNKLPAAFNALRLPGSKLMSATGEFGTICIQEFEAEQYSIRYSVFELIQRLVLRTRSKEPTLSTSIMLKGQADRELGENRKWSLRQNQFSVISAGNADNITILNKDTHISFDAFFSLPMAREFAPVFPPLEDFSLYSPVIVKPPQWVDAVTFELVHSMLNCKYEQHFRRLFFDNRVRDLLFNMLLPTNTGDTLQKQPTEKEIQAIYEAERLINHNIADHIPIPTLSRKVLLNEFQLKSLFKKIFGVGPYEYLIRKRMNRAKDLLSQGYSVKEVASQIGYRPSDFTTAFRDFFGVTPSSIKKRD